MNEVWFPGSSNTTVTVSEDTEGHLTAGLCGCGGRAKKIKAQWTPHLSSWSSVWPVLSNQYTGACCRDTGAALGTDSSLAATRYGLVWLLCISVVMRLSVHASVVTQLGYYWHQREIWASLYQTTLFTLYIFVVCPICNWNWNYQRESNSHGKQERAGDTDCLRSFQNCHQKNSVLFNIPEAFNKSIHSTSKTYFLPHKKQNTEPRKAKAQPEFSKCHCASLWQDYQAQVIHIQEQNYSDWDSCGRLQAEDKKTCLSGWGQKSLSCLV